MVRLLLVLAAASIVLGAGVASASPPAPGNEAGPGTDLVNYAPARGDAHAQAARAGSGGNLTYHGGKVLRTNRTVAIYWGPASGFASGYDTLIGQYFSDVAHDGGTSTNVYSVLNQYYDGTGPISYSSTYDGAIYDTSAYPAAQCSDTWSETFTCLSDSQFRAEVAKVVQNPDPNTTYFVFTGKGVGSCYSSTSCAFTNYCAYHMNVTVKGVTVQYANQPYTMTVPSQCDSGYHPNGSDADPTINVVSHEHRESINDPLGNAWYDRRGYEGSDKCAWNFGAVTGNYNQTINGHHYILQQEWSNSGSTCKLHA